MPIWQAGARCLPSSELGESTTAPWPQASLRRDWLCFAHLAPLAAGVFGPAGWYLLRWMRGKLGLFGAISRSNDSAAGFPAPRPFLYTSANWLCFVKPLYWSISHNPFCIKDLLLLSLGRKLGSFSNHESSIVIHKSEAPPRNRVSLYPGAVLHESCRNSVCAWGFTIA
jgi:hypothetical protein